MKGKRPGRGRGTQRQTAGVLLRKLAWPSTRKYWLCWTQKSAIFLHQRPTASARLGLLKDVTELRRTNFQQCHHVASRSSSSSGQMGSRAPQGRRYLICSWWHQLSEESSLSSTEAFNWKQKWHVHRFAPWVRGLEENCVGMMKDNLGWGQYFWWPPQPPASKLD